MIAHVKISASEFSRYYKYPVMQTHQPHKTTTSPYKGKTGLRRLRNAVGYSLTGFKAALQHEDAFRQETLLTLILIPLALHFGENGMERALMITSVLIVLIVELLNSAIEAAVDHTSIDHHPLAGRAKDIGSAAVLLSLIIVAIVWGLILLD